MICKNCGADIPDQAKFCPQCGTRRVGQESNVSAAEAESEAGKLYATVDPKRTSRATDSTSAPKAFQTRNANSEKEGQSAEADAAAVLRRSMPEKNAAATAYAPAKSEFAADKTASSKEEIQQVMSRIKPADPQQKKEDVLSSSSVAPNVGAKAAPEAKSELNLGPASAKGQAVQEQPLEKATSANAEGATPTAAETFQRDMGSEKTSEAKSISQIQCTDGREELVPTVAKETTRSAHAQPKQLASEANQRPPKPVKAVGSNVDGASESSVVASFSNRVCPRCGTELPVDARFCDACGASLDSDRVPQDSDRLHCPHCGQSLLPGDTFCVACGKLVNDTAPITVRQGMASMQGSASTAPMSTSERTVSKKCDGKWKAGLSLLLAGIGCAVLSMWGSVTMMDGPALLKMMSARGSSILSVLTLCQLLGPAGMVLIVNGIILMTWGSRKRQTRERERVQTGMTPTPWKKRLLILEIICGIVLVAYPAGIYMLRQQMATGIWAQSDPALMPFATQEMVTRSESIPQALWIGNPPDREAATYIAGEFGLEEGEPLTWKPVNGFCSQWFWLMSGNEPIATLWVATADLMQFGYGDRLSADTVVTYQKIDITQFDALAAEAVT